MRSSQIQVSDRIIDTLEYVYGPLFISIGFSVFLATADPAFEVMLALADHVANVESEFLVFVVTTVVTLALLIVTGVMITGRDWPAGVRIPIQVGAGILWSAIIVGVIQILDKLARAESGDLVAFSVGFFAFVPIALWQSTKWCLAARDEAGQPTKRYRWDWRPEQPFDVFLLNWVGRLPLLGAGIGLIRTGLSPEASGAQELWLWVGAAISIVVALVTLIFQRADNTVNRIRDRMIGSIAFVSGLASGFVVFVIFVPSFAELAGPVAVASIFVITMSVLLARMTVFSSNRLAGFPIILVPIALSIAVSGPTSAFVLAGLIAVAVFFVWLYRRCSLFARPMVATYVAIAALVGLGLWTQSHPACTSLAGCHIIRGAAPQTTDRSHLVSVPDAYSAWIAKGPADRGATILAAQGGGLFAAKHTGHYLAARADIEPEFANQIFAISSVSGGSVGAAVFWAIRKSGLCDTRPPEGEPFTCHRDAMRAVMERDYLSPVLSGLLFRDLFDTVVPISAIYPDSFERGNTLYRRLNAHLNEYFEDQPLTETWTEADRDAAMDLLRTPLSDSVSGDKPLPFLFINATDAHSGVRLVLSPIDRFSYAQAWRAGYSKDEAIDQGEHRWRSRIQIAGPDGEAHDLTVGEAAVLSARFPVVTPPGRYQEYSLRGEHQTKQVVDGGYFDNTGIETVHDILIGFGAAMDAQRQTSFQTSVLNMEPGENENLLQRAQRFWQLAQSQARTNLPDLEIVSTKVNSDAGLRKTRGLLAAPIHAFSAAANARRTTTYDRFCDAWKNARVTGIDFYTSEIDTRTGVEDEVTPHNFTLSWLLTRSTFGYIEDKLQAGENALRPMAPLCDGG